MNRTACLVACVVFLGLPLVGRGQAIRYELGQRLRAFENAWEKQTDAAARQRALVPVQQATPAFFSFRLDRAAEYLDRGRFALHSDKQPDAAVIWAESLAIRPTSRFLDRTEPTLAVTLETLYKVDAARPDKVAWQLSLLGTDGKPVRPSIRTEVTALPASLSFDLKDQPLPEGDHVLRSELLLDDRVLARWEQTLSAAKDRDARLKRLREVAGQWSEDAADADRLSVRGLLRLLEPLAERKTLETNYPAARLLAEAEATAKAVAAGQPFYGQKKVGQFWLWLPTGKLESPVRLQAPDAVKAGKPLPLVIALHGAGGSENLFFDGYGNGLIARLTQQRGWLLVAPRHAAGGNLDGLIREVGKLYPVDEKRIFLVGHSMGAGQAVAAAVRTPERYVAVAALGGGGSVQGSDALQALPFFVGIGTQDFALRGARSLRDALKKADVRKVEYREYAVEHLIVVQDALRDVFEFFDAVGKSD